MVDETTPAAEAPAPAEAPDAAVRQPSVSRVARAMRWSRRTIASLVWLAAVLGALCLSVGALLIALDADRTSEAVKLVLRGARLIDGPFWQLFHFSERTRAGRVVPDDVKNHLVNWGLAALAYLAVGRLADRVIRPAPARSVPASNVASSAPPPSQEANGR